MRRVAARRVRWAAISLAIVLIAAKAYYLTLPGAVPWADEFSLRLLVAVTWEDVSFAVAWWVCGRLGLTAARNRPRLLQIVSAAFVLASALACAYAVANIALYGVLGGFLTYQLLALVGDVGMLRSSITAYLTPSSGLAFICLLLGYVSLVYLGSRPADRPDWPSWMMRSAAVSLAIAWIVIGHAAYTADWTTRQERAIVANPHWLLLSSWWRGMSGAQTVRVAERFADSDLADFEPMARARTRPPIVPTGPLKLRPATLPGPAQPPNVVLVVLESVAARWTGLHGGVYDTTPMLLEEASRGVVFDSFYAHIGRSSSSLVAILMSMYPRLDFRDVTEQYPRLPGTSVASVFRDKGYRTGFITPSDLDWAGWGAFLQNRGFDEVRDRSGLPCTVQISSWGVEDRCMVDGILDFVSRAPTRPFFLLGWTTQTHHPYVPTPGVPMLKLLRERQGPDDYDLDRYLNVLHETDRHLGRLFDALRRAGLDRNTLVVVTGDHGQAFGSPHDVYAQGHAVYEEDVHVPLMFWFPRMYRAPVRSNTVGSHVDLAPTILDLAGLPPVPEWQGRSLFESDRPPRAYFYAAGDRFELGVREGTWKYVLDVREGVEQLYDLDQDPTEQNNLAAAHPDRCRRLRQRLAAWTDANARQYARVSGGGR